MGSPKTLTAVDAAAQSVLVRWQEGVRADVLSGDYTPYRWALSLCWSSRKSVILECVGTAALLLALQVPGSISVGLSVLLVFHLVRSWRAVWQELLGPGHSQPGSPPGLGLPRALLRGLCLWPFDLWREGRLRQAAGVKWARRIPARFSLIACVAVGTLRLGAAWYLCLFGMALLGPRGGPASGFVAGLAWTAAALLFRVECCALTYTYAALLAREEDESQGRGWLSWTSSQPSPTVRHLPGDPGDH